MLSQKQHLIVLPRSDKTMHRLDATLDILDQIHSAASEGHLSASVGAPESDVVKWLYDIIYTAQETIGEIEKHRQVTTGEPLLRIVENPVLLEKAE